MTNNIDIKEANAYTEVLEVLNNMSSDEVNMIPKEMIEMFRAYSNKEYEFKYDLNKNITEQGLSKDARLILAMLFRDYWATDAQKEKIIERQRNIRFQNEVLKRKKFNTDNLFKNKGKDEENTEEIDQFEGKENNKKSNNKENLSLVTYKEPLIKRIINKIKSFFHK